MHHHSSQHFDLEHHNAAMSFSGGDPTSWLSGQDLRPSSPSDHRNPPAFSNSTDKNAGRLLYNDLVQIVPLVQSLIGQKASSWYTRRGSMIYTKKPPRESISRKMNVQSVPGKKHMENGGNEQDDGGDGFLVISSTETLRKEREELCELRQKVEDLQRQLLEKDEMLKSSEASKSEVDSVHSVLDQVEKQALEKDG